MEDIIGMLAGTLTTISFIPQVIKVLRTKNTKDLSLMMYVIIFIGVLLWLIYGIAIDRYPMIIANAITIIFVSIILFMKNKHG